MVELDKPRRKELKTQAAPRPDRTPVAVGRGPAYRIAHACFSCRRSFKLAVDFAKTSSEERPCPTCGQALAEMGRSFTAPKMSDADQWRKVEALWNAGFRFFSYRSYPDAEPLPSTLREVDGFVERNTKHPFRVA